MAADSNRCPTCGDLQPVGAPQGICPRCLARQTVTVDTPDPVNVDATASPAPSRSGHSPEAAPADSEMTGAHTAEPLTETGSPLTHGIANWTPDPTETDGGNPVPRDVPSGTTVR
jgi:hypothetical protein